MTYEVRTGRKIIPYNIKGISKGRRNNDIERRDLIFEIIRKNPSIWHTHILKIIENYDGMALKTAEKLLNMMDGEGLIKSTKIGTSPNAIRSYDISQSDSAIKLDLEYNFGIRISNANELFLRILKNYSKYPKIKQNTVILNWVKFLHHLQSCITIGQVERSGNQFSKQKKDISRLINETVIFIHKNLDYNTKRFVFSLLYHEAQLSNFELKKYLEMNDAFYHNTIKS
jgi:hypothetical protein